MYGRLSECPRTGQVLREFTAEEQDARRVRFESAAHSPMLPPVKPLDKTFGDIRAELERLARFPFDGKFEAFAWVQADVHGLLPLMHGHDRDALRAMAIRTAANTIKLVQMIDGGRV